MTFLMSGKPLEGVWGAVLLALDERGEIEWTALSDQLSVLSACGVHGVYTNGTAGEFHGQTEAEFDRLLTASGFRLTRVVPNRSPVGLAIVEAVPVKANGRENRS